MKLELTKTEVKAVLHHAEMNTLQIDVTTISEQDLALVDALRTAYRKLKDSLEIHEEKDQ